MSIQMSSFSYESAGLFTNKKENRGLIMFSGSVCQRQWGVPAERNSNEHIDVVVSRITNVINKLTVILRCSFSEWLERSDLMFLFSDILFLSRGFHRVDIVFAWVLHSWPGRQSAHWGQLCVPILGSFKWMLFRPAKTKACLGEDGAKLLRKIPSVTSMSNVCGSFCSSEEW